MIQWGTMTIHERMALRTDKKQPHECWLWNGPLQNDGYAHIKFSGITMKAHRVAWLLANGEIIDGRFVCHHCDHRSCVNPNHLFLGTHADNMRDAVQKGRFPCGEQPHSAKLTDAIVLQIRAVPLSVGPRALGRMFGISHVHAMRIRRGEHRKNAVAPLKAGREKK